MADPATRNIAKVPMLLLSPLRTPGFAAAPGISRQCGQIALATPLGLPCAKYLCVSFELWLTITRVTWPYGTPSVAAGEHGVLAATDAKLGG